MIGLVVPEFNGGGGLIFFSLVFKGSGIVGGGIGISAGFVVVF